MKSNKLINISIFALVILLATSFTVTAFGVTSLYWDGNPLILMPGETREVSFTLQNMVGDEDLALVVEVTSDKQYVKLLLTLWAFLILVNISERESLKDILHYLLTS